MPELPEVETIARALRPDLTGAEIVDADVRWARTLATPSPRKFNEQIRGQRILEVGRRAKFMHIQLSAYSLFVHLRMSGDLFIRDENYKPEKHDRLILNLSMPSEPRRREDREESLDFAKEKNPSRPSFLRGEKIKLVFNDTRKFGRVWLTDDPASVIGGLGPEPFSDEFTPQWLYENLLARKRQLKPLLLDQTFLAGLGNIYTDECLHIAKLHPQAASDSVSREQATRLHEAIRAVLAEGIRRNGASIDWVYRGGEFQNYFRVYDRAGKPCPVCGTKIQRLVVGQRGTHVCPKCQKLKRQL